MSRLEQVQLLMHRLHDGVKSENGQSLSDQIQGTVDNIARFYDGEDKEDILVAGYLHKAFEKKSINPRLFGKSGKLRYGFDVLSKLFGYDIAHTIFQISTKPDDRLVSENISSATAMDLAKSTYVNRTPGLKRDALSEEELQAKAVAFWASELPVPAQVILLAENLQIFEQTNTRPQKSFAEQRSDYTAGMYIAEAVKEACPAMYQQCVSAKEKAMSRLDILEASLNKQRQAQISC